MKKPTEAELDILKVLWHNGPSSVREVHDQLAIARDIFYTTTLKTMQVMASKGLVIRDTSQRSHIYSAAIRQSEVEKKLIDSLVNSAFNGSAAKLVISALGQTKPTGKELEEIRALLNKYDKNEH